MHNSSVFLCKLEINKTMDLKRLRTFVAVAELSTVSKAALHLRISQSALSRQISDLEQEFGFKLFDRIGRRLVLTAVGEHLPGDCRSVLGHVGPLGERVELLRRGDSGVLKVAASPQMIESVLSRFLPRYAERFPNVHVKLTEALGHEQTAMLERGEVHIGIRHEQGDPRFESRALTSDQVLAVCEPSLELGHAGTIDSGRLASYPLLLLESEIVQRGWSSRRRRAQYSAREPRPAHPARARRGGSWGRNHSGAAADRSLHPKNRPRHTPAQAAARAIGHSVGQAAPHPALCQKLFRCACRIYAADPADHAAIGRRVRCHAQTTGGPQTPRSSKFHAAAIVGSITLFASVIFVAGKPPVSACLRIIASSLAASPPLIPSASLR